MLDSHDDELAHAEPEPEPALAGSTAR
jgi:hypothetical protein